MKKLLSIILTITMIFSVMMVSTVSGSAKSVDLAEVNTVVDSALTSLLADIEPTASKNDVAPTGTRTFKISEKAEIPFSDVDGYPYGYIGDANGDTEINIFDATEIQTYLAQITSFIAVQNLLADVNADKQITIMDVTEIQFYLADLAASEIIHHVLYSPSDDCDPLVDTFDDIVDYLIYNGEYDDEYNNYYVTQSIEEEGVWIDCFLDYFVDDDLLSISTYMYYEENDLCVDISMYFERNNMDFVFSSYCYDSYDTYYYVDGYGYVSDVTDEGELVFDLTYTTTEFADGVAQDEILSTFPQMCFLALASGELLIQNDVVGSFFDLVMPRSMIL